MQNCKNPTKRCGKGSKLRYKLLGAVINLRLINLKLITAPKDIEALRFCTNIIPNIFVSWRVHFE